MSSGQCQGLAAVASRLERNLDLREHTSVLLGSQLAGAWLRRDRLHLPWKGGGGRRAGGASAWGQAGGEAHSRRGPAVAGEAAGQDLPAEAGC